MTRAEYLETVYQTAKRGTELSYAKLTEEKVRAIRREWEPYSKTANARTLAEKFGVCRRNVERILAWETWVHVR